jgi:hypothetical protein
VRGTITLSSVQVSGAVSYGGGPTNARPAVHSTLGLNSCCAPAAPSLSHPTRTHTISAFRCLASVLCVSSHLLALSSSVSLSLSLRVGVLLTPNDFPCRLPRARLPVRVALSTSPFFITHRVAKLYFLQYTNNLAVCASCDSTSILTKWRTSNSLGVIFPLPPAAPLVTMATKAYPSSTCPRRRLRLS